ncbi:MAG: N-6 DNA methylase, partial [Anaerolineales bacterium]|nr:N-6 DNA methylase [Anaerolineales bacterium]
GLGPNLFYNSPMEACVLVCRSQKPPKRQGKVLFIDAVNEIARERAMSYLRPEHQQKIEAAYTAFANDPAFAKAATLAEIAEKEYSLSIPLYVKRMQENGKNGSEKSLPELWADWEQDGLVFWQEMEELVTALDNLSGDNNE